MLPSQMRNLPTNLMHAVALPAAAQVRPLPRHALARVAKVRETFVHPIGAAALPVDHRAVGLLFGDSR